MLELFDINQSGCKLFRFASNQAECALKIGLFQIRITKHASLLGIFGNGPSNRIDEPFGNSEHLNRQGILVSSICGGYCRLDYDLGVNRTVKKCLKVAVGRQTQLDGNLVNPLYTFLDTAHENRGPKGSGQVTL